LRGPVERRHIGGMAKNGNPTLLDNFFYLLTAMEHALDRGGIEWTASAAASGEERLMKITAEVAAAAKRLKGDG
jgi:hypothetical protein